MRLDVAGDGVGIEQGLAGVLVDARGVALAALVFAVVLPATSALAQGAVWPNKPVKIVIGFPADFRAMRVPTLLVPLQTSRPFFADRVTVALGASGLSAALDCSW